MDCSPPGSSVFGIFQARILEWVAIPCSRGSSLPRDWTHISCIARQILYCWSTREAPQKKKKIVVDLSNRILCQSGSQQKSKSHTSKIIEHLIIALFTKWRVSNEGWWNTCKLATERLCYTLILEGSKGESSTRNPVKPMGTKEGQQESRPKQVAQQTHQRGRGKQNLLLRKGPVGGKKIFWKWYNLPRTRLPATLLPPYG